MPITTKENRANGEPTAEQRPEKQTNAQAEERANEQQEWANG